jgi:beta-glucosidase
MGESEMQQLDDGAFDRAVARVRAGGSADEAAADLYDRLTDDERLGLLDGDEPFWQLAPEMLVDGYNTRPYVHGAVARLGIPGTRFVDGPRGCVSGHGTAFPVSMSRGATWDLGLEEEIGLAIGREIRAQGGNFFGGVCINLPRHPAWGRIQETYGDDPHHLGEFGAALTRGAQRYVMACVKHYALNSMENARFSVDVLVDDATLHDVYLPHFRRVVDEGVASVMAAYNSVNGEWAGQNKVLLTDILRDQWGFTGITATDFVWGMRDGAAALEAGMDLEEPAAQQRATHLRGQMDAGETSWDSVRRSGLRILSTVLRSYARRDDGDQSSEVMACPAHRALARRAAAQGMVLLKNEPVGASPVLPLGADVRSIAVIGRLANEANMGDHGSSDVRPPTHVTPIEGIRAAFPGAEVVLVTDTDPSAVAAAAAAAEVAIVVAGFNASDEGEFLTPDVLRPDLFELFPPIPEDFDFGTLMGGGAAAAQAAEGVGGDRASLRLHPADEGVILAAAAANPRTVVSIVAAGAVLTEQWRAQVPAVLLMWYAGMEGGHALADVLSGRHNPSGRLPFSIPTSEDHLPFFDRDATSITYDRHHGQRLLDRLGVPAAFPHGFGLSYTTYELERAAVEQGGDGPTVSVTVANRGGCDGRHVVQVYGRRSTGSYAGELVLVGFGTVEVPAGGSAEVRIDVSLAALAEWDPAARRRVPPQPSDVVLEVGSHAHDPDALTLSVVPV